MSFFVEISNFVSFLGDAWTGTYVSNNHDRNSELLDISRIPSFADDNNALISDRNNVCSDMNKAYKVYKERTTCK